MPQAHAPLLCPKSGHSANAAFMSTRPSHVCLDVERDLRGSFANVRVRQ
jgi:hypothetical protein